MDLFGIKKKFLVLFVAFFSAFLIIFSLISTVQLKLVKDNGDVAYFNYSFQYPAKNLVVSLEDTKYQLQNVAVFNILGNKSVNIVQQSETTLRDITSPTKTSLLPLQVVEDQGERVVSNHFVQLFIALLLSIVCLLIYTLLSSGILFKRFSFLKTPEKSDIILFNKYDDIKSRFEWKDFFLKICLFFWSGKLIYFIVYYFLLNNGLVSNSLIMNITPWDSGYYRSIIYGGYDLTRHSWDGQANWAFFPVFPLVCKLLLYIFHSEYAIIIFNQILLFASLSMLYIYALSHYNKRIASMAIFFLAIGSENIYFASIYTESMFLFLSLATLLLLDKNKYLFAAVVCGILSGVRMQGLMMSLIVVYHYVSFSNFKISLNVVLKSLLLFFLSITGFIAFISYLGLHVGDPLAFYHIQDAFGRSNVSWVNLIGSINSLWKGGTGVDRVLSVVSIAVMMYFYQKRKYCELLFFALCFFIELASKSLQSYSRFFFANYATYIFLGAYVKDVFRLAFVTISTLVLSIMFIYLWLISSSYVW